MTSPDMVSLMLALGGVVGSAARSALTASQPFASRKTATDLVIGALVGFLWPLYPLIDFPAGSTTLQQAVIVAAIAYITGDALINVLTRLGSFVAKEPPKA